MKMFKQPMGTLLYECCTSSVCKRRRRRRCDSVLLCRFSTHASPNLLLTYMHHTILFQSIQINDRFR